MSSEKLPVTVTHHSIESLNVLLQEINPIIGRCELLYYPTYENFLEKDIRKSVIKRLVGNLYSLRLLFKCTKIAKSKESNTFWDFVGDTQNKNYDFQISDWQMFHQFGYISRTHSAIENFLRILNEKLYGGNIFNFSDLYPKFLNNINLEYIDTQNNKLLLKLLTNIRNSSHNNGIYKHPDDTIEYKGKNYEFKENKLINFITWDFLLPITNDLITLIELVNKSPIIENEKLIIDPNYYKYYKLNHVYK